MKTYIDFIKEQEETETFKRKPNKIEAFQWTGEEEDEIPENIVSHKMFSMKDGKISIKTLEGTMTVSLKDWIVIGVAGELFPVKPDIFKKNYQEA